MKLSLRLKVLLLASLLAWFGRDGVRAQPPDCTLPINVPVGTAVPFNIGPFDNRTAGCTTWQITYNSTVYSALSLLVQTAPNSSGVPGSWSTFTAVTGANPNTTITQNVSTFGGVTSYFPWLRVQLTSATGAGTISGRLYGWRIPPGGTTTAVISGTVDVDLVEVVGTATVTGGIAGSQGVGGLAADGAALAGRPVLIAGTDGTNAQSLRVDSTGAPIPAVIATAITDDLTNTPTTITGGASSVVDQRTYPFLFDGATWDRQFACSNNAFVNLSGSGNTEIVPLTAAKSIRLCQVYFSSTAPQDIKLTRGTGANCGTGTNDLGPLFKSVQSGLMNFGAESAILVTSANAVCMNQSAVQATGVWVTYAVY